MLLQVKYTLEKNDYSSFYLYAMWDAPSRTKARLKYYLRQVLVNAGIILLLLYVDVFRYSPVTLYIYIGILSLVTLLQLLNARYNIKRQAQRIVDNEENQSMFLEGQLEINEAGITKKNELETLRLSWAAFTRKQETAAHYFLFTNSLQALIIPKRVFKGEELQQFEKLLLHYLSFDAEVGNLGE